MVELRAQIVVEPPNVGDVGLVGGRRPECLGVTVVGLAVRVETVVIGALLPRFETLGRSGTAMADRGTENARRYTDTGSDRSDDDSRQAMTRVGSSAPG